MKKNSTHFSIWRENLLVFKVTNSGAKTGSTTAPSNAPTVAPTQNPSVPLTPKTKGKFINGVKARATQAKDAVKAKVNETKEKAKKAKEIMDKLTGAKAKIEKKFKEKLAESAKGGIGKMLKTLLVFGVVAYIGKKIFGVAKDLLKSLFGFKSDAESDAEKGHGGAMKGILKLVVGGAGASLLYEAINGKVTFAEISKAYGDGGTLGIIKLLGEKIKDGTLDMTDDLANSIRAMAKFAHIPLGAIPFLKKKKDDNDKSDETKEEEGEILPNGHKIVDGIEYVPAKEKLHNMEKATKGMAGSFTKLLRDNKYSTMIVTTLVGTAVGAGTIIAMMRAIRSKGFGALKGAKNILGKISSLAFTGVKKFPLASFAGFTAIMAYLIESSKDEHKKLWIPKDKQDFKKWFEKKLNEKKLRNFMEEHGITPPTNIDELYEIMDGKVEDVEQKVEDVLKSQNWAAVTLSPFSSSEKDLVIDAQKRGVVGAIDKLADQLGKNSAFIKKLEEYKSKLTSKGALSITDIQILKSLADKEGIYFNDDDEIIQIGKNDDKGILIEDSVINLCVNPALDKDERVKLSKSFISDPNGPIEAGAATVVNEITSRINGVKEVLANDPTGTIMIKGGMAYLITATESKVLAPFKFFKEFFTQIWPNGKKVNATKLVAAYASGLVPVTLYNLAGVRSLNPLSIRGIGYAVVKSATYPVRAVVDLRNFYKLDMHQAVKNLDLSKLLLHRRQLIGAHTPRFWNYLKKGFVWKGGVKRDIYNRLNKEYKALARLEKSKEYLLRGNKSKVLSEINGFLGEIDGFGGAQSFGNISDVDEYKRLVRKAIDLDLAILENADDLSKPKNAKLLEKIRHQQRKGNFSKALKRLEEKGLVSPKNVPKTTVAKTASGAKKIKVDIDGASLETKISAKTPSAKEVEKTGVKIEKNLAEAGVEEGRLAKLRTKFKSPGVTKAFKALEKAFGPAMAAMVIYQAHTSKDPQKDIASLLTIGAGSYGGIKLMSSGRSVVGGLVLIGTVLEATGILPASLTDFVHAKLSDTGELILGGNLIPQDELWSRVMEFSADAVTVKPLLKFAIKKTGMGFLGTSVEKGVMSFAAESGEKATMKSLGKSVEKGMFKKLIKVIEEKIFKKLAKFSGKALAKVLGKRVAAAGAAMAVPVAGWAVGIGMAVWTAIDAYKIGDVVMRGRKINKLLEYRSHKNVKNVEILKGADKVERGIRAALLKTATTAGDRGKIKKMSYDELVDLASGIPGSEGATLFESIYKNLQDIEIKITRDGDDSGSYEIYDMSGGDVYRVVVSDHGEKTEIGGEDWNSMKNITPNLSFRPEKFEQAIDYNKPEEEVVSGLNVFLLIMQSETHWDHMKINVKSSSEINMSRTDANGRLSNRAITRSGDKWKIEGIGGEFSLFKAVAIANLMNSVAGLEDVKTRDAGSNLPFENDDGDLDFDVEWNPRDLNIIDSDKPAAQFYKKVGLDITEIAYILNTAYRKGLI